MTTLPREPPEASVRYELDRLVAYADRLARRREGDDQEITFALIEAYLVHYRNLLDFLTSRGRPDTIKANEYVEGFTCDLDENGELRQTINRALTHLSRDRGSYQQPRWKYRQMLADLTAAWNSFIVEYEKLGQSSEEE
jgi:hypothetical protein